VTLELRAGTTGAVKSRPACLQAPATTPAVRRTGAGHAELSHPSGRSPDAITVEVGPSARLGALDLADAEKLAAAVGTAVAERLPLVLHISSTGALVGDGIAASHGWGLAARALVSASGVVPVLASVHGPAVSGMALLLGLADQVVVTESAYAFVTGPRLVAEVTGVPVTTAGLGGAGVLQRSNGLASLVVADRADADEAIAELLGFLPAHCDGLPPRWSTDDPCDRLTPEAAALLPATASGSYDVRDVARSLADDGELLELRAGWAPNLVTALATFDGHPVGILANQPMSIAGTLDIAASQKGARFVAFCDAFNLPLVTLVDTPGFYPGKNLEWRGMIRHGAQLAFAYARATVPRINVTLRKSYGGAYIVMDSKTMGNDVALAWPTAEIAVMGASGAVEILHRGADESARADHVADYEDRLLNPYVAADRGLVDAVIEPAHTRAEICAALAVLSTKRERLVPRHHDNMPL
jgi:acetyl-CoA carboxylase carboxyltransferase component